jgi:hypothetical protein
VTSAAVVTTRDVQHRLTGLAARTRGHLREAPVPEPDQLVARVRARLGRLVSHPGSLEVTTRDGVVTLAGPIFESEAAQLLAGVRAIPGVREVDDSLERHQTADHVPALQGRGPVTLPHGLDRWRWTPSTRLLAGTAGLALIALSSPGPTVRATAARVAGLELLGHALVGLRERGAA